MTIDRPARRNACNLAAWRDLAAAFTELGRDRTVRLVILTGAAGHFCAGADISEFSATRADSASGAAYEHVIDECYDAIAALPQPSIAAIGGSCVGGGCALAMSCDFRVARDDARFGIPAAKLGAVYTIRECNLLFSLVGIANAKRILYSGSLMDAAAAARIGLVDECVAGDPIEAAIAFADAMIGNAPLSIEGAKLVLQSIAQGTVEQHEPAIQKLIDRAFDSEDSKEGGRAFLEKRRPRFSGR
ncbi:MAG: enoyl-CoA hydratase-related protein [Pseudomonadota bacterium]